MNSIKDLWNRRIRFLLKLYYDFIAFQLDLVSVIYLLALVIFLGYYYFPEVAGYLQWIKQEPWRSFVYLFSIKVATGGKHSGYLKEADELFLTPLNLYGKGFLQRSHRLNRCIGFFVWGIWLGILAVLDLLPVNPLGFFLIGLLWRYIGMNGKFFLQQVSGKWIRRILGVLLAFIYLFPTFLWVSNWESGLGEGVGFVLFTALLLMLLLWTDRKKRKSDLHWSRMISEETNRRAQRLSAIIQVVPEEKSRGINTARTLKIFSGVRLLPFSPVGATILAFERRIRRGRGNFSLIVKIGLVHFAALIFVEQTMVQVLLNLLVFFIIHEFCLSLWNAVLDEEWFHIYPFAEKTIKRGITLGSLGYVYVYMLLTFTLQYFRWGNLVETGRVFLVMTVALYLLNLMRGNMVFFQYHNARKNKVETG